MENNNQNGRRPAIPHPVQREVRQRCGFGCVVCGCPIYDYHHMKPYAEVQAHTANNLTLLCVTHHREVTNKLLTDDQVAAANKNPKNVREGVSQPYALDFEGEGFQVNVGSNVIANRTKDEEGRCIGIPIAIDDQNIISFCVDAEGRVFLNMCLFDEFNRPLLQIHENALIYRQDVWDIKFSGNTLDVRQAVRKIFITLEFCPPNEMKITNGRILYNGIELLVRPTHLFLVNKSSFLSQNYVSGLIGVQCGRNLRRFPVAISLGGDEIDRYNYDRKAALAEERKCLRKLEGLMGNENFVVPE